MPTDAKTDAKTDATREAPAGRRGREELAMWLVGAVVAAGILVGTVVGLGGRIEAATWGLVVAAAAMVFALRSLYRMATALARPPVEAALDELDVAAYAGKRELREERRRLLRAINELQFDYEMGKLSDDDYRKVRQGYELQAVEVIRALDAEAELHPALAEELRRRGLVKDEPPVPAKPIEKASESEKTNPDPQPPAPEVTVSESEKTNPDPKPPAPELLASETEKTNPDPVIPAVSAASEEASA